MRGRMTGTDPADEEIVFASAKWPWIALATLAGLAAVPALLALAVVAAYGPATDTLTGLALGGGLLLLLGLGAWRAKRRQREVALDAAGLTIRRPRGSALTRVAWTEVRAIERRRVQAHDPYLLEVAIIRRHGTPVVIDPQQMGDTARLAREARRLHEHATRHTA
jgi:hypothetical protein